MSRRRALLAAARSRETSVVHGGELSGEPSGAPGRSRRRSGIFRMAGTPLTRPTRLSLEWLKAPDPPPQKMTDSERSPEGVPETAKKAPVEWTVDRGPALPTTVDADVLTLLVRDPWIILAFWSLSSKTLQQQLQDPLGNTFLPSRFRVEFWAREGLRFVTPEVEAHGDQWISVTPGTRGLARLCAVAPSGARVPLFWSDLVETPRPVPGQAAALHFRDVNVTRETAELLTMLDPLPLPIGNPAPILPPDMPRAARQWIETPSTAETVSDVHALRPAGKTSPNDSEPVGIPTGQKEGEISALVTPPAWAASPAWKEWQAEILRLDALERAPVSPPVPNFAAQTGQTGAEKPALMDLANSFFVPSPEQTAPFSPLGSSDLNPLRRS